ncbi:integrase catalytic subunit [Clostridium sp. CAG:411]|nr:integrase catalytic subunit [Clostridium sp. CAG:411]
MVTYKTSQYSVPPEYIGKEMKLQVYDNYIHIYYNTALVTLHSLSSKKLNYHEKHYIAIARQSGAFKKEDIESRAKENLSVIGDVYRYE